MNELQVHHHTNNSSRAPSSTRLVELSMNQRPFNLVALNVDGLSNSKGDIDNSDDIPQSINYESDQDNI